MLIRVEAARPLEVRMKRTSLTHPLQIAVVAAGREFGRVRARPFRCSRRKSAEVAIKKGRWCISMPTAQFMEKLDVLARRSCACSCEIAVSASILRRSAPEPPIRCERLGVAEARQGVERATFGAERSAQILSGRSNSAPVEFLSRTYMQVRGRVAALRVYATNGGRLNDQYSQENSNWSGYGRNTRIGSSDTLPGSSRSPLRLPSQRLCQRSGRR
jgi:hypothetical protein